MTKEAFKIRIKALGWKLQDFCNYVGIRLTSFSHHDNIPKRYLKILNLLEQNKKLKERLDGRE